VLKETSKFRTEKQPRSKDRNERFAQLHVAKKRKKIQNKKTEKLNTNFISGIIADKSGQIT